MSKREIEEKLKILQEFYKIDFLRPFPLEDCRSILSDGDKKFTDFIPSLDIYFSDIAGYCSWGRRIEKWSDEQIKEAKNRLGMSFFQRFGKFSALKGEINEHRTPRLYSQLLIFDLIRLTLLDIFSEIETENSNRKPELSLVG